MVHGGAPGRPLIRVLLCRVGVFLYVSVSISDWHDRIASSLMERVRGSLLLTDEEGGSDEPVDFLMLLHRFERVQPGEALNIAVRPLQVMQASSIWTSGWCIANVSRPEKADKTHSLPQQV